jgi:hypothetical protein
MRRTIVIALTAVAALLASAAPASAAGGVVNEPWVPLPEGPFDLPAGSYCDFAVHGDSVVDQVETKVVVEYPDGSIKKQLARGALLIRVTNTGTGAATTVNASGDAVFDFFPDGSQTWHVVGPVLAGFKDGGGNVPRGLWKISGVYDINFSPANYKTVTIRRGGLHDVCADIA